MARRVFLHIGGEKTGTTTLQYFLAENASLLKRAGFYFPCESNNICCERNGHFPVAAALMADDAEFISDTRRKTLSAVLGEVSKRCSATDDAIILSCEHFSSRLLEAHQLRALHDALPCDDIKIVFYAREPSELSLAAWSTSVQCGNRVKFNADEVTPDAIYYNHLTTLDLWAGVFGHKNVIVRDYQRAQLLGHDIRKDFCGLLGIDLKNARFEEDQNLTLDLQRLEVLRHLNDVLPPFQVSPDGWYKAQIIRKLVCECIPQGESVRSLMSAGDAAMIKSRFNDVNQELNRRYFGGRLSRHWFAGDVPNDGDNAERVREQSDLVPVLRDTIIRMAELTQAELTQKKFWRKRPARRGLRGVKRKFRQMFRSISDRFAAGDPDSPEVRQEAQ